MPNYNEIERWSSGNKWVEVGSIVRIDDSTARYRVSTIRVFDDHVEIHAWGGKKGRLGSRVFAPDQVIRCVSTNDPNQPMRDTVKEISDRSKRRRTARSRR